jgi:glycosyltransferase involved in cell wall biosynthesis
MEFTHVHQILPALHVADASGAHARHARDALREAGFASELFVDQVDAELEGEVRRYDELDGFVVEGKTALIYQMAVGSRLVDRLVKREEPLLVNYHNLTPASFYWKWAPDWLEAVALGRSQLYELAPHTRHAIAVSEFNEKDLRGAGYRSTSVVPPFVEVPRRPQANGIRDAGATSWLFVGKLLPHKAAHDLVRGLAAYRKAYEPDARLVLIGGHPIASYAEAVKRYAGSLGLEEAVEMKGSASAEELEAAYEAADVFVCASEHEGFCFPLLEAMSHGVPIVAYEAGAVVATVGDAGIVVRDKSGPALAAAVRRVVSDGRVRERLGSEGAKRLRSFDLGTTKRRFAHEIGEALERVRRDLRLEEADKRGEERLERRYEESPPFRGLRRRLPGLEARVPGQQAHAPGTRARAQAVRAVHQLVPMLVRGDATSQHAIQLREVLQEMGLESEIFASAIDDELHDQGLLIHELPDRKLPGTVLVYQMSSGSPMVEFAAARKERLWINYHNITPGSTYDGWEPAIAAEQRWGRRQVARLAGRVEIGICDSKYNASELASFGYGRTFVCPVLIDFGRVGDRSRPSGSWLFVGRIAPHKGQHRLVQTLAAYSKIYGITPRLDLVGSVGSLRYAEAVRGYAEDLGISDLVAIVRGIDDRVLGEYYAKAGVLVSASIHEGFCVPIIEAMHVGVPVVALASAAVPETAGKAALLVDEFDPGVMASVVQRVGEDATLRGRLVEAGRERAVELSLERSRARMREVIERCLDGAATADAARRSA